MEAESALVSISGLKTYFRTDFGDTVKAVDGVDLEITEGKVNGLVGESGCGKSTLALSITRLLPLNGRIVDGKIIFNGENLVEKDDDGMRRIRGGEISMIFQDPTSSLNPVFRIGTQIEEAIRLHGFKDKAKESSKKAISEEATRLLKLLGVADAERVAGHYPHEYSGGMRQRAMIAMAMSCRPELLIADEPTTNLDVTIQAQVNDLVLDMVKRFGATVFLITHDLGIVAEMCDRVAIMYAGKVVECADTVTAFKRPKHPYAEALLSSIPRVDMKEKRLKGIPGTVPSLVVPPPGCRFHPRCRYASEICMTKEPPTIEVAKEHTVSCWRYTNVWEPD